MTCHGRLFGAQTCDFAARLKPRPFKTRMRSRVYSRSLNRGYVFRAALVVEFSEEICLLQ